MWRREYEREAWWELRLYEMVTLSLWDCTESSTACSARRWKTGWEGETFDLGIIQYVVNAVINVCCTWCMLYSIYTELGVWMCSVYAVLTVNSWLLNREIERDDTTLCSYMMAELKMRMQELRGDGGNHYDIVRHKRIRCASQLTLPDMAGTSCHLVWSNTIIRYLQPKKWSHTPDFAYPLVFYTSFSKFIPHLSLSRPQFHYHHRTQSQVTFVYLSMSWSWVDMEYYSILWVQHTPSTAYAE